MALSTTALILESNGEVFLRGNNVLLAGDEVGLTGQVPTPDGGGVNQGDFWVTPVNDQGAVTGLNFTPYNVNSGLPAKPKPYSLAATKIRVQGAYANQDYFFVLGTSTQWAAATLPTSSSLVYWPTSQEAHALTDSNGIVDTNDFKFILGIPTLDGSPHKKLFPKGWYNGTALTAAAGAGYSNITTLLVFLNANWTTPSITVSWTAAPNNTAVIGSFTSTDTDQLNVGATHVLDAFVWAIS